MSLKGEYKYGKKINAQVVVPGKTSVLRSLPGTNPGLVAINTADPIRANILKPVRLNNTGAQATLAKTELESRAITSENHNRK
jgi:hypothetical protein